MTAKLLTAKVDPFAVADVGREHSLKPNALWLYLTAGMRSGWRSGDYCGSFSDLAEATRLGRNTVSRLVDKMKDDGLLIVVEEFHAGIEGRMYGTEWPRMLPGRPWPWVGSSDVNSDREVRAPLASPSRRPRSLIVTSDAIDQGEQRGSLVSRKGVDGSAAPRDEDEDTCALCPHPIEGHPFTDHEPESRSRIFEPGPWHGDDEPRCGDHAAGALA